ncbi:hypothetical protein E4S40_05050 [Algoriphagus kandeliae]|uniref:Tyrosine kinase G-rich domain-containing protein n=1 Tax=Algoriphagus kandeliae TaxID=2562278 RepID=A0A4Y9QT28_9BACT|nr:hypothetical protein [Algoriphagus kandeliae]TFV95589.1 hypothetical protein E4S40_05050 [Algoriphagus kandeliae]
MTFVQLVRLLVRFAPYLLGSALFLAVTVAYFSLQNKKEYKSHTLLNTGLISGYNIESSKGNRIDYAYTNNEIDNLINLATSLETNRELSARLFAELVFQAKNNEATLLEDNDSELEALLESVDKSGIKGRTVEELFESIKAIRDNDKDNEVYKLTYSKNPLIGVEQLETIKVFREGSSDMIRMEYTSIDPFLSKRTLELLTEIFINKQKNIKEGQSDTVIQFFEEATQKTLDRLKNAEDELLSFRVKNQIINYYEQTRFIAGNREELDKKYQEQLQIQAAAQSSLNRMESEISDKQTLARLQNEISKSQGQIADYNFALMELSLLDGGQEDFQTVVLKEELEQKINSLKAEMMSNTAGVVDYNHTTDGVPTTNILTQWLNSLITYEEATAQIQVIDNRMKEYDQIYDRFAPLGSTLRRLESEIDVAEREYLENLHSYNQARLHKYNMMMSTNLKVIDFPYYPAQPEKSKAAMMVILSFLVGLVLPAGLVVTMEILDGSLKTPKNASSQTGLKLVGILPQYPKNLEKHPVDFDQLSKQALNLFVQELRIQAQDRDKVRVTFSSIQPGEGKSSLISALERHLATYFPQCKDQFELKEIPSLLHHPFHLEIQEGEIFLLIARADRKWTEADQHALKVFKKFIGKKPLLFLNRVRTDIMEEITGEVPRRRSWIRAKVKSLLS